MMEYVSNTEDKKKNNFIMEPGGTNKIYVHVSTCVCARGAPFRAFIWNYGAGLYLCMSMSVPARACACVCACVRACSLAQW